MYIALDQIEKGENPTVDDLALVSDAVELVDNFYSGSSTAHEIYGVISRHVYIAREALLNTYQRNMNGANIRLTGTGMQAVRIVMDRYYSILKDVPERTILQLHRATELANIKSLKEGNAVILKGTVS